MFPISKPNETPFRGKADSSAFNEDSRQAFLDIISLFSQANELNQDLDWAILTQNLSEEYFGLRVQELQTALTTQNDSEEKLTLTIDMMETDNSSPYAALIDSCHGFTTIKPADNSKPKLYLVDSFTGETVLSESLNIVPVPAADNITIYDQYLNTMVDPSSTKFWLRKIIKDQPEDAITSVIIDIPESIITNRNINYITIAPYPAGSVDILKVEYQLDNNTHQSIPADAVNNATNSAFIFAPIGTRQIKVTLRQRYYLVEDRHYVYYFGIRKIGVYNLSYQNNRADLVIPITFNDTRLRQVTKVKPIFVNSPALTDTTDDKKSIFNYGFYNVLANNGLELVHDIINNTAQTIMKVSLGSDPVNQTAPALKAVELTLSIIE